MKSCPDLVAVIGSITAGTVAVIGVIWRVRIARRKKRAPPKPTPKKKP